MQSGLFVELAGVLIDGDAGAPESIRLLPGVGAAVRRLNLRKVPVVVVTDQPAIGRGDLSEAAFAAANQRLIALLAAEGAALAGIHHCSADGPDPRRKPRPGLILSAARAHALDLSSCWLVGCSEDDARAAAQAGCAGAVLVGGAGVPSEDLGIPVAVARDLADAPRVMINPAGGCWHDRG